MDVGRIEETRDASLVHALMMLAFEEYRDADIPSSALDETEESVIERFIHNRERALLIRHRGRPVGMVRLIVEEDFVYFYRLSIIPSARHRGFAQQLVEAVEQYGKERGATVSVCKVRMHVRRNIALYEKLGYTIVEEEQIDRNGQTLAVVTMEKLLR